MRGQKGIAYHILPRAAISSSVRQNLGGLPVPEKPAPAMRKPTTRRAVGYHKAYMHRELPRSIGVPQTVSWHIGGPRFLLQPRQAHLLAATPWFTFLTRPVRPERALSCLASFLLYPDLPGYGPHKP